MKFSFNWLKEYLDNVPDAEKVAEKIGLHSFELEGVEKKGDNYLIDWDILPNRSSDCLCYLGMAKEISTVFDIPFKNIDLIYKNSINGKSSDFLSFKINDEKKAKAGIKKIALNVKVKDSPEWLKEKMESIGQRSINNVVDITNYVMWVTGQPVHAFDYDKIAGEVDFKEIEIRNAVKGEEVETLSGEKYILDEDILVIADKEKALDIAGIKGGSVSGVDFETKRVLMSAVNFDFKTIRKVSRKLKLQTDASKRFENEVPLIKLDLAMSLFSKLMIEVAEAEVLEEVKVSDFEIYAKEIKFNLESLNSFLGLDLNDKEVIEIFRRLFFEWELKDGFFIVKPPLERLDLNTREDIFEEIGRIWGYDKLPESFLSSEFKLPKKNKIKEVREKITFFLTSVGFYEVLNRTMVEKGELKLKNSLNTKAEYLRSDLLNKLKERMENNFFYKDEVRFFEFGKVFNNSSSEKNDRVVEEKIYFSGIWGRRKIKEKMKEKYFFETKGFLEKIFDILSLKNINWIESKRDGFLADIYSGNDFIGSVGINFWEIDFEKMVENIKTEISYKPVSKFPLIKRDLAFWVPEDYKVGDAEKIIKEKIPVEVIEMKIFDIFKDIENNRKSLAFNLIFQSDKETLSDQWVNEKMDIIYSALKESGFEIR